MLEPGPRQAKAWASPLAQLSAVVAVMMAVWAGLGLRPVSMHYSVLQLGIGAGFVVMYYGGPRFLPAIALGHAIAVWLLDRNWMDALASGVIEAGSVALGLMLLGRWRQGFATGFGMNAVLRYLGFGVVLAAFAATLGRWCYALALETPPLAEELLYWFLGHGLGNLILAPLVLAWVETRRRHEPLRRGTLATTLTVSGTLVATVFSDRLPGDWAHYLAQLWLPLVIWIAWRGELVGASLNSLLVTLIIGLASRRGIGLFAGPEPEQVVLHWQSFIACFAASSLILAAVARERRLAEQSLRQYQETLEDQVRQRTRDLEQALAERAEAEAALRATAKAREQAHERLNASERRSRQLIETLNDGLVLLSADARIEFCNRRFGELLGWASGELKTRRFPALFRHSERPRFWRQLALARRGGVPAIELEMRGRGGQRVPVLLSPAVLETESGGQGWSVVCFDLRERKAEERARQDLLRVHRDALVREVHHRIKNNLQGIVGLLRQYAARFPTTAEPLENAIAQVNSVALVYGLQSREHDQIVRLRGLVSSVQEGTTLLTGVAIACQIEDRPVDGVLSAQEGVPVALVLNELLTNAVKHRTVSNGADLVSLRVDWHDDHVMVSVSNPARPGAFPPPAGSGGTGLSLVRALLPSRGASLTLEAQPDGSVCAALRLSAPVLFLEPCAGGS